MRDCVYRFRIVSKLLQYPWWYLENIAPFKQSFRKSLEKAHDTNNIFIFINIFTI